MHRFFAAQSDIYNETISLSDEDARHIRAIRLRPEELFVVCDGAGTDYICRLGAQTGGTNAEVLERRPSRGEPDVKCSVFIALMKGQKLDVAVQKSVELGAFEIVLFPSKRTQPGDTVKKLSRLQKIAQEAAKQSHRGIVPQVRAAESFSDAVSSAAEAELPLFFYEHEERLSLQDALESAGKPASISILTGPEGGFAPEEAQYAAENGIRAVTLGPRVLRCETAPIAALSAIMFQTGNL